MPDKEYSKGRIRDARGRSVKQLDPVTLHVLHRYSLIEAEVLEEIVEELEPGTAKRRRQLILIVPGVIVLFAAGLGALYYFSDASLRQDLISTLTNPAIGVPSVFCCIIVPWIAARQKRFQQIRFAMLRHRRCPHCGYDLRGLPVDDRDLATVCPECGCAWRMDEAALSDQAALAGQPDTPPGWSTLVSIMVGVLLLLACAGGLMLFMQTSAGPTPWLLIAVGVGVVAVALAGLVAYKMTR